MKRVVYIYDGEGAKMRSRRLLQSAMEHFLCHESHVVSTISPEQIKKEEWRDDCAAVVFGGGYDKGFIRALGDEGIRMVRDYVLDGGTYLGFCAGGYFGCDYIEFDKGGKLEVCGERHFKFYPGKCIGPVVPGFQYSTDKGLDAMFIKFHATASTRNQTEFSFQSYVNGGGCFVQYSHTSNKKFPHIQRVETLATYTTLPQQPAAIVRTEVGHKGGVAILTGPHPEFSPFEFDYSNPDLEKHLPALRRYDRKRERCMRLLLQSAGLQVSLKTDSLEVDAKL